MAKYRHELIRQRMSARGSLKFPTAKNVVEFVVLTIFNYMVKAIITVSYKFYAANVTGQRAR